MEERSLWGNYLRGAHTRAHTRLTGAGQQTCMKDNGKYSFQRLSECIFMHINIPVLSLILVLILFRISYYSIHYHNSNQGHNHLSADVS